MKRIITILTLASFLVFPTQISAKSDVDCPNVEHLEKTTVKDKDELVEALEKIVPSTYGKGDYGNYYSEWEVITAAPFPNIVGNKKDEAYYGMAKNFCGEEVANQSWLVRLHFPRWEGKSASASEGQIFLAKSQEDGWFVWFRYH
ncbi:hypothetical protein [Salinibacillus xinjiangensis]|uniref:Uncharacterized protein n=1 Tax=Salinibacillus xinjiangensis TaxID=1229268 RepID=A0A6G1X4I0_9BACI|nr:hypothetical protein [Salinibacillus xinjiangensis]MRG85901.1 hypothetical protein [Salinibacillus xinjiangensis]